MASPRTSRVTAGVLAVATAVWVLLLAGVGSSLLTDDPPADSPYATRPGGDGGGATAIGPQPIVSAVGFDGGWVEITNTGDAPASLEGWWLCNRPSYYGLPAVTLGPGESLLISATDEAAVAAVADSRGAAATAAADGRIGSITVDGGEVGLYTSSSFGDPTAIVAYVEWGSSGHGRSGTAVEAGVWTDGDFVDAAGTTVIEASADAPTSSSGWSAGG